MPTPTYIPLATITLGSSASSVTFSSIPATYRDLVLNITGTVTASVRNIRVRANNDSTGHYSFARMFGSGTVTNSASGSTETAVYAGNLAASTIGQARLTVMDYSATDKHKTFLIRQDLTSEGTQAISARWPSTSAITTLTCSLDGDSYAAGTTFNLYGIAS
jgi:hypothetical protein